MIDSPIKTNVSTNQIHKYVLFLASVILIFSLFIDVKILDNSFVQKSSFTFVIIGLIWWLLFNLIQFSVEKYCESDEYGFFKKSERQMENYVKGAHVLWVFILIIGFVIGFVITFR